MSNYFIKKTTFDSRIYSIFITITENYPNQNQAPIIQFRTKINLPIIDANGVLDKNKFNLYKSWNSTKTLVNILVAIKNEMQNNKKLDQPAEHLIEFYYYNNF